MSSIENRNQNPTLSLNNGIEIPRVGFGVFKISDADVVEPVKSALAADYKLIDTAAVYGNETGVGQAISESAIARDSIFVTSKVWNTDQGYDSTLRAFDASLDRLGLDYLDLYLIHWPVPALDKYVDTWKALEKLYADGRVRSIGVSNFNCDHLEKLLDSADVVPAVNQIELHPNLPQHEVKAFNAAHGILTQAWSPMARGELMNDPVVVDIATAHDVTPAQVLLRWHIQQGNAIIPKSVNPDRIRSNKDVFGFSLAEADVVRLNGLENGKRVGSDPATMNEY